MVVPLMGGPSIDPKKIIILIIGPLHEGILNFGKPKATFGNFSSAAATQVTSLTSRGE